MRILAISPLAGIGPELRQVERAARAAALAPLVRDGLACVHEIEPADREALAEAVEIHGPPDIIHFYGHGRLRGNEGELLLDAPRGGDWFAAAAMASLVGGVGLVALFACQGASINVGAGEALLGGVAQSLVAAGAPAVLGMQLAIRANAAAQAAASIYRALATGESLQTGVARARRALFVTERDTTSWFVPALYLRERSGGTYALRPTLPAPQSQTAAVPNGAHQSVIARGGTIRALRIQGQTGSHQRVYASRGGEISDVAMRISA
ncbi:MAG: CHAT domain-containing protein [Candidatus Viridilinea halotolerans]|uniref:CHAT domain-containing protein n=1 Tax=Candidatus Viridilinea halotolerans TaxID=2491704 RepID=A0A426TS43_9CHLR|nr:MAG: CHAT domain-containing protein [Candidatus Viridilinea halotolerans]